MNLKNITKNLIVPGDSLTEKTIKSGFWVFALRIVDRIFQLARLIILARLLSPNDFGLFGIALLTLSALETLSQTGFKQALIQKKENIKPFLNTAWTIQIIRGLLIALVLFFIAPHAALFFAEPRAEPILQVIGLAIILHNLTNVAVVYFEKELKFHKYFAYNFAGTLADFIVAISAAILLQSVWALVLGFLARNLVKCIASYMFTPYRPKLQFNFEQAKELFGFGKWILGSSALVFLLTQGDDVVVGKLLGVTALGLYQIAYRISNMPATEISHIISQVTFPAYSKLQDNISKLREGYLKVLQVTAFLSFPIAGLIFILAPDFTRIFLGEKWVPMIPAMQVLALFGLIRSIGTTTGPLFQAVGKPEIATRLQFAKLILLLLVIYPFTMWWGIFGAALAVLFNTLLINPFAEYKVLRVINCRVWDMLKLLVIPAFGTILMYVGINALRTFLLLNVISLPFFIIFAVVGLVIYIGVIILSDRAFSYGLFPLLRQQKALYKNLKKL